MQPNGLSNNIQEPFTDTEAMEIDYSATNKHKISTSHTQFPTHYNQFSTSTFILTVIVKLISEPKAFNLLSLSEKQHFTKDLCAIIRPITKTIKWSKLRKLIIFPSSEKQKEQPLHWLSEGISDQNIRV